MPRLRAENIEAHKQVTRDAILDAAAESFQLHGYEGTSLSAVADLSGLPRSSLYAYFANKDEMLGSLVAERVTPLFEAWLAALPSGPPLERVQVMFLTALELAAAHPLAAMLGLVARERLPVELQRRYFPRFLEFVDQLVLTCNRAICDAGEDSDAAAVAAALRGLLLTGVEEVVSDPEPEKAVETNLSIRLDMVATVIPSGQRNQTGAALRSVPLAAN